MHWSIFVLAFACVGSATPLASRWDDLVEKHSWSDVPKGWVYHATPPPDQLFEMRIGLKQDKADELISTLYEVSQPGHPKYGQHLTKAELNALVAPHPDTVKSVEAWLSYHDVDLSQINRSDAGEWITITVSVSQAERMLGTTYNVYHHSKSSDYVLRTIGYSIPKELQGHIDVISPTTYFGTMRSMRTTSFLQPVVDTVEDVSGSDDTDASVPSSCNSKITPACLKALYNTANYTVVGGNNNTLGVSGYLEEFANDADLQTFFTRLFTAGKGTTFTHVQVNGGENNQSDPGVEANLDIQYTEAISFPIPNIYYSTGGSPPFNSDSQTPTNTNEPYLNWLQFILALPKEDIPQTITTSYGDDEQTVPEDYATTVCNLFAQLGTLGTTVLFSSGDFAVGGGDCETNSGNQTVRFQPDFPASCPFVTAVGGTTGVNPEQAIDFSGGGFSNYFVTPDYQSDAVSTFLSGLGSTNSGLFNKSGRGYPDIAAQASGFQVVIDGITESVAGTSCSSPTAAGIVSLLNDFRLSKGLSSLGFLNPLIYSNTSGFNDITSGSNPGCGTDGFTAGVGWDPVTGLGTFDFVKMQSVVLA